MYIFYIKYLLNCTLMIYLEIRFTIDESKPHFVNLIIFNPLCIVNRFSNI